MFFVFFCFPSWFDCVCLNVWSYCYRLHSQMISGAFRDSQWKLRALSQTAATLASQLIRGSRRSSYRARQHVIIGRYRGHRTLLFLFLFFLFFPPFSVFTHISLLYFTFLAPLSSKLTGQVRSGKRKSLKWGLPRQLQRFPQHKWTCCLLKVDFSAARFFSHNLTSMRHL